MNDLIKKRFFEESEVLLKSEMVTLVGGESFGNKNLQDQVCQNSSSAGCNISCNAGCSKQRAS